MWNEKTTWIEKLNLIPGLNLEEKSRARILLLEKPAEDRLLYLEGGYAESAASIKALLALTPPSLTETTTRSTANDPLVYTFGPDTEGSVSASTYLRPVQPRISNKWSKSLSQTSAATAKKDATPVATPRSVSWGDLNASLFAYSLAYPFAPWRAISEMFYTGPASIGELMRNVDPSSRPSTISEVMRNADPIGPRPGRPSNPLAAAKPSSGSSLYSVPSQEAPKANTRMQGPGGAEKTAVRQVPWTAWRDMRSNWRDVAASQTHMCNVIEVAEKASAAWAVCMDPGDIFFKVDRQGMTDELSEYVTKVTTTFFMVVKVLEDFTAILVKVKPLEKSLRKVVPDPADSYQLLKSRYAQGEMDSEEVLKWKRVPKGWTKWSKEWSKPQDHGLFAM